MNALARERVGLPGRIPHDEEVLTGAPRLAAQSERRDARGLQRFGAVAEHLAHEGVIGNLGSEQGLELRRRDLPARQQIATEVDVAVRVPEEGYVTGDRVRGIEQHAVAREVVRPPFDVLSARGARRTGAHDPEHARDLALRAIRGDEALSREPSAVLTANRPVLVQSR